MAYEKTVWVNGQAPALDAEHLNKIEQGIADAVSVTPQTLSAEQQVQARGNISALNGQFLLASSAGGTIGWYRITEPFSYYFISGYLTVSHAWGNGGASELLLGVSSSPDTHGKLQCLRGVGQINSAPYISNARLVNVSSNMMALDLYVSGTGTNDWALQLCNCGQNPITLITPTFISADDTLPSGETLAAVMEYQNPPMLLGVEYKTTERYMGKPVYVKTVLAFSSLTGSDAINTCDVSVDNADKCISCTGETATNWSLPSNVIGGIATHIYIGAYVYNANTIQIFAQTDRQNWTEAIRVTLKYTKTTD